MEAPSFARSQELQDMFGSEAELYLCSISQARSHSLVCLLQGPMTWKWIYMDRSTAGDYEVFEDTDRELQDLVRLEVQWASSFCSTSS